MNAVIDEPELMQKTGYDTRAQLRACLEANGVKYMTGKRGRVFTTVDAFNAAMGLAHTAMPASNDAGTVEIGD